MVFVGGGPMLIDALFRCRVEAKHPRTDLRGPGVPFMTSAVLTNHGEAFEGYLGGRGYLSLSVRVFGVKNSKRLSF